jgi:hypothetical protein
VSASIGEQILARAAAALTGSTPAGARVFRDREIGLTRGDTPAIVISAKDEPAEPFGDFVDHNALEAEFQVYARGEPWETVADSVYAPMHAIVTTDAQLLALCSSKCAESGARLKARRRI